MPTRMQLKQRTPTYPAELAGAGAVKYDELADEALDGRLDRPQTVRLLTHDLVWGGAQTGVH